MIKEYLIDPFKNKFQRFIITWLQVTIFFFFIYSLSLIIYYFIYSRLLPTPAIQQSIYFDYTREQPQATVSLTAVHRQWTNLKAKQLVGAGARALKSGAMYDIEALLTVAKSPRNLELGKIAITTSIIDNSAEAIAKSIRPVVVPYYTDTYLFLETIFTFPTRFFGLPTTTDSSRVFITIMRDYQEPYLGFPGAEIVELVLSSAQLDLIDMELIILPQLNFITYWLFHYPRLSFMVGLTVLSLAQFAFYSFICFLVLVFTLSTSEQTEQEFKQAAETLSGFEGLMDELAVTQMQIEMEREQQLRQSRQERTAAENLADSEQSRGDTLAFYFPDAENESKEGR